MENLHSTAAAGGGEAEIRSEVSSLKEISDTDPVFCFFLHEGEEDENEERSNKGKIFSPDQQENVFL